MHTKTIEDLLLRIAKARRHRNDPDEGVNELEAQVELLRFVCTLLRNYARHTPECPANKLPGDPPPKDCACGLDRLFTLIDV